MTDSTHVTNQNKSKTLPVLKKRFSVWPCDWLLRLISCFVLFIGLLLCFVDPVWYCHHLVGTEGAAYVVFLWLCIIYHGLFVILSGVIGRLGDAL